MSAEDLVWVVTAGLFAAALFAPSLALMRSRLHEWEVERRWQPVPVRATQHRKRWRQRR